MRYLWIKAGVIANIVEYPTTPPETENGNDIVPAVTGLESVGDAFDVTDTRNERQLTRIDGVILKELFRITNAIRTLNAQANLSAAQYRAFLKTLI